MLALTVAAALVVSGTGALEASASTSPATNYAVAVIKATNAQRSAHHVATARYDSCLKRLATAQASRMARAGRLSHQSLSHALRTCNLRTVGENVGGCFRSGTKLVNVGWMKSPAHRAILLNRHFHRMGVSARYAHGCWWVSQVFGTHR
jgi:uncharacterized protein YkwD